MKKNDRKSLILQVLNSKNDRTAMPEILEKLGVGFNDRTVRRLLSELRVEEKVIKSGAGPSTQYRIVKSAHNQIIAQTIEETASSYKLEKVFKPKSLGIINAIRQPIFTRKPVSYMKSWLQEYIPNHTYYLSSQQRQQLLEAGNRNLLSEIQPAGTYSRKILNRLLIDLSYNSSRLEGNTYSKLDTEKLLVQGLSQTDKLDAERVMILNHKDAIEYLVRNAEQLEVSYKTICTIHYLLSDGLLPTQHMGKVRNQGVRIGHSSYYPLEDNRRLEANLQMIIDKAAAIIDPYEQSLFLLIHIAYLQPFLDINKRTSRISANISLVKSNVVPLSFNEINQQDYISAMLAVYELNQVAPMVDLYCFSYLRTCQAYDATVESIGFDPIRVKYRRQRRDLITYIIRNVLTEKDVTLKLQQVCESAITNDEQQLFKQSVYDDLRELTVNTISGLGISEEEFVAWKIKDK